MILRQKIKQISVSAVRKKIQTDPRFLFLVLTSGEVKYCESKRHSAEPAAARIAAKEACLSLFKIPAAQWIKWMLQIKIQKKSTGKPFIVLSSALKKKVNLKKNQTLLLSLAHERNFAIAWVVLVTDAVPRGSVSGLTPPRGTASGACGLYA